MLPQLATAGYGHACLMKRQAEICRRGVHRPCLPLLKCLPTALRRPQRGSPWAARPLPRLQKALDSPAFCAAACPAQPASPTSRRAARIPRFPCGTARGMPHAAHADFIDSMLKRASAQSSSSSARPALQQPRSSCRPLAFLGQNGFLMHYGIVLRRALSKGAVPCPT